MSGARLPVARALIPLCIVASVLAAAPWLRTFPVDVGAAPLVGAAVLSVLVPALSVRLSASLWLGALVDVGAFVVFTLVVVLHDPIGFAALADGLYHGPSQILSFALPLVSPRSLLVAPVALSWLAGALAGECLARRWTSALPYGAVLVAFGLAYAASQRAAAGSAQLHETLLAAGFLSALLVLRTSQAWLRQESSAQSSESDGELPLLGLAAGVVGALIVALAASAIVQSSAFPKRATAPQRVPSIDAAHLLGPVSFVAGLRPRGASQPKQQVFTVSIDQSAPGYFGIANLDTYDGAGWSFERTFRPSGGVLPDDADLALRTAGPSVRQTYLIRPGPLSSTPWLPMLYRPRKVTGTPVDIDQTSGMIVAASALSGGGRYTVESAVPRRIFADLRVARASADTASPAVDSQLPADLHATLERLVREFVTESGVPSAPALPFLQALQQDLRAKYLLSGPATGPASSVPAGSTNRPSSDRAGGTGFAEVLASILGQRSATPEQFATLVALIARELGVPARVVTGFRASATTGTGNLPAGRYSMDTSEAWTWAEVPVVGQGWVVLDAAPSRYSGARQPDPATASPPSKPTVPSQNALVTGSGGGHAVARRSAVPRSGSTSGRGLLFALLAAAGALALSMLLVFGSRKRVRAARRRRGRDPRTQLLGAWQESIDMLSEAGLPELSTSTSAEIAAQTQAQFGPTPGQQTAELGRRANAVAYDTRAEVGPEDVEQAWAAHYVLRRSVRLELGWRGRMSAALRYHREPAGRGSERGRRLVGRRAAGRRR